MSEEKKLFFLGPEGTYSELAAKKAAAAISNCKMTAVSTIAKVVDIVNREKNTLGVLPVENSIEGIVRATIDNIYSSGVLIQAQIELDIEHCFISKNSDISNIRHIVSHPQAIAQCQRFILENFDENVDLIETSSTAAAGRALVDYEDFDDSYAAIVSPQLAQKLNLNILNKNIADNKQNKTRFVVISSMPLNIGKKTRTTIVFNTKNEPGALLGILNIINKHNINLVYLESRPSRKVFGEYNFFCDIDKGLDEIEDVLKEIEKKCNYYKLLGSYCSL